MAQLTERDKALLQNDIDKIKDDNKILQDGIDSDTRDLNNLTLYDIPSKKFVDELHFSIFQLEEEARILTGKTIIGPVQENAFAISTTESNVAITISDARFIAKKNGVTFVDIPLIDSRAYVLSAANSSPNFDIWTRDRHGSATSEKGVQQLYTIHSGNNQLTVTIDGVQKTFNVIDPDTLDAQGGNIQNDPLTLAGNVSLALEAAGFSGAKCLYNSSILTFTIASGTAGPNSTAVVNVTSTDPDDLAFSMKFSNQVNVPGRFANNKAKIAIDGSEQEITLTFDMRIPVTSSLGQAIDDYSADWRTDFSSGPMFPAENNNGKKVASLLQGKLREVGSGGFKSAEVVYYSTGSKFLIYSGTFGATSNVEIKSADADRDFCKYIGLSQPSDQKNKETAYTTLQSLYDYLNSKTVIVCSNLSNPTFPSYSLLSIQSPIIISSIPLYLVTTSEYDRASLAQPRLYSGKLRISSSNNKLDVKEGSSVLVKTIPVGDYSEGELCEILTIALNTGSITYTVTYQKSTQKFIITASGSVTMLFGTGANIATALTTYIGFTTADVTNTSFTSNPVSFSGVDFYSMASIPQFIPMSWFSNTPPYYYDSVSVKSEQGLINAELTVLQFEDTSSVGVINDLKTQTSVSNESMIYAWENAATAELNFVNDLIVSIQTAIGLYSATSTSDTNYNNLVTALNNAIAAKNNLLTYLAAHNYILNLRAGNVSFTYGSNFTLGGTQSLIVSFSAPNSDRLYNLPAIEFKYADTKYVPMKNSTSIYSNSITFDPFITNAFSLKSNVTSIPAYVLSSSDGTGLYTLQTTNNLLALTIDSVDYSIALATGTNISGATVASDIQTKLRAYGGGLANTNVYFNRFDCSPNKFKISVGSAITVTDKTIIVTSSNNKIDFEEVTGSQRTATISTGSYNAADFTTAVQNAMTAAAGTATYTVSYSGGTDKLTIASNGFKSVTISASNNKIDFEEINGTQRTATIASATYSTGASFATAIQTALNAAAGTASYTVFYNSSLDTLTLSSNGGGGAIFKLRFLTGSNTATSAASAMGFNTADKSGLLAYTSDNVVMYTAIFTLKFATGTNSANSAAAIMGFNLSNKSGLLSYTSDNTVARNSSNELNFSSFTTDVSHVITDTKLTITDTYISTTIYWAGGSIEHLHYDFSSYTYIKSIVDAITNDYPTDYTISIGKSTLWSKYSTKFLVNNGEQFQIQVANGSTQTVTISATSASLSGTTSTANIQAGDTLTLSLNGETARTITIPIPINSQTDLAAMIQSLVRSIRATNVDNQYAYSLFTCTYSSGFTLRNGISGSGSSISISGGTLATKLGLSGSNTGSGNVVNNTAVTTAQLVSLFSSLTGVTVSDDNSFLKIQCNNAGDKLQIISNSLSNRIGFYTNNVISDFAVEYTNVNCMSIQDVSNQSIQTTYDVLRGYENRGNITATFSITDNVRLNSRQSFVVSRESYLATRLSQISSRISTINSALSPTLYNNRWNEVVKRLNKKTGSYFKVGEKQLAIVRSQQTITDNNARIQQLQAALGG